MLIKKDGIPPPFQDNCLVSLFQTSKRSITFVLQNAHVIDPRTPAFAWHSQMAPFPITGAIYSCFEDASRRLQVFSLDLLQQTYFSPPLVNRFFRSDRLNGLMEKESHLANPIGFVLYHCRESLLQPRYLFKPFF